jgi:hypothetical protein
LVVVDLEEIKTLVGQDQIQYFQQLQVQVEEVELLILDQLIHQLQQVDQVEEL